jgi:hypothetical protein
MKKNEEGRRSFLRHVLAGSAVVAGIAATRKPASAGKHPNGTPDGQDVLYRETDEFKKYYESLRS